MPHTAASAASRRRSVSSSCQLPVASRQFPVSSSSSRLQHSDLRPPPASPFAGGRTPHVPTPQNPESSSLSQSCHEPAAASPWFVRSISQSGAGRCVGIRAHSGPPAEIGSASAEVPVDQRTGTRVIQAALAFPLACLVGFGGSVLARTFRVAGSEALSPSSVSRPSRDGRSDRHLPAERDPPARPTALRGTRVPTA